MGGTYSTRPRTSQTCYPGRASGSSGTTSRTTCTSTAPWTGFCTSPRRPHPWTIWNTRSTRSRSGRWARSGPSGSRRRRAPASSWPRHPRCTETLRCTRSRSPTGATSTPSALVACTTRPSVTPRPWPPRTGEPLTVHGTGAQTRSLCFVDDMVEGFWRLLSSDEQDPVNLGNPEEVTVLELAEAVREAAGSDSEIVFTERPVDDPEVRCPDITVARQRLGWEPQVPLREGLKRTVAWARDAWS